jgi:hypothetical protein
MSYLRKVGIPFLVYAILFSGKQAGAIDLGWFPIVLISVLGGGLLQVLVFGLWGSGESTAGEGSLQSNAMAGNSLRTNQSDNLIPRDESTGGSSDHEIQESVSRKLLIIADENTALCNMIMDSVGEHAVRDFAEYLSGDVGSILARSSGNSSPTEPPSRTAYTIAAGVFSVVVARMVSAVERHTGKSFSGDICELNMGMYELAVQMTGQETVDNYVENLQQHLAARLDNGGVEVADSMKAIAAAAFHVSVCLRESVNR